MKKTNKSNSSKAQVSADRKAASVQENTMSTKITLTQEQLDKMIADKVAQATAKKEPAKKAFPEIWKKENGYQIAIPIELVEAELAKTKEHNANLGKNDKEWKKVTFFTKFIFGNRR